MGDRDAEGKRAVSSPDLGGWSQATDSHRGKSVPFPPASLKRCGHNSLKVRPGLILQIPGWTLESLLSLSCGTVKVLYNMNCRVACL